MKKFLTILSILFLVWVYGFFNFLKLIPNEIDHEFANAEAIIVFTGGKYRIERGLELSRNPNIKKILISGVPQNISKEKIIVENNEQIMPFKDKIDIGYLATNTTGNAKEATEWVRNNAFNNIILITGNYHIPRSNLEFRSLMPDLNIINYPVFPEYVKLNEWWQYPGTLYLLLSEYNKYIILNARIIKNALINR